MKSLPLGILIGFVLLIAAGCGNSQRAPEVLPTPSPSPSPARKEPHHSGDMESQVHDFWRRAKEIVYKSPDELKAQHQREKRKGVHYSKLMHGDYRRQEVALTFDDGPHRKYTPQLLKILKRYEVKATFFVVGKIAERNDDLLRQEYQEGHCIGNHSYHHVDLTKLPDKDIEAEWLACNEVIKSVIGVTPKYCRPPGGNYDDPVIQAAMKYNLITILWTDDPGDYAEPGKEIIEERVLYSIYDGGIILLHDGIQQTINILPGIIEHLQKQGYSFITIEEMCKQKRCELTW